MGTFSNIDKPKVCLPSHIYTNFERILPFRKKVISNYFTQPPRAKMLKKFTTPIKDK